MNHTWMITKPRNKERQSIFLVSFLQWVLEQDIKKWIIAEEEGTFGYQHWQIRIKTKYKFEELQIIFGKDAHIEEASDTWEYERKEGVYYSYNDTIGSLADRYGTPRKNQSYILYQLREQPDRAIDVVVDTVGNTGKSWLCRYLYEKGLGFYVPPYIETVQGIIQFITSGYKGEEIILIDIPRSWKWSSKLYTVIEAVKDGLVTDTRYSAKIRNIHGVKVLVMTNTMPKLDALSKDRWRIYDAYGNRQ